MKTTVEIQNKIIELYNQDVPHRVIAKQLSIGINTILRTLKKNNIPLRGIGKYIRIKQELIDKVLADFNNNVEIKDICSQHDISYHICKKIIIGAGFEPPGSGRKRIFNESEIKDILNAIDNNETITFLTEKYNANYKTMYRLVKTHRPDFINLNFKENHGNWKGGKYIDNHGYVVVRLYPDDPFFSMANTGCYVLEHRYIMAQHLGRCLEKTETVHHIDGNRQNNAIDNLQLRNKQHGKGQIFKCADCGSCNIQTVEL